jgi:hypothetical protein
MGIMVNDNLAFKLLTLVEAKMHEFTTMDSDSNHTLNPGKSLLVRMAASHWGYVNNNLFNYNPDTVNNSLITWTKPRPKPVMTSHPGLFEGDPEVIGRILNASYTKGIAADFIEDDRIPNNKPDGYLEFATRISGADSIQRIIDKRYDTVSISAVATNVTCSVCNSRLDVSDSECKHERGKRYNEKGERDQAGKLCWLTAGPLLGRHVAFVAMPGDSYAGVLGFENDGVEDALFSSLIGEVATGELWVVDSAHKILISLHDEEGNVYDRLNPIGKTFIDIANSYKIESISSVKDAKHIDSIGEDDKEGEDMAKDDKGVETKVMIQLIDTVIMTDAELDAVVEQLTEDAKLSYQGRKDLPDSAFCGPDRSFPAHDAAHVRAGLQMLNKSKDKDKGAILSCLRGRAPKFGIKVATKVKDEGETSTIESMTVADVLLSDATIEDMLHLDIVIDYLKSIDIEVEDKTGILPDDTGKDANIDNKDKKVDNDSNDKGAEGKDTTTDAKTTDVNAATDDGNVNKIKTLDDNLRVATAQNIDIMERYKKANANRVVDLRIMAGKATAEDREKIVSELMLKTDDYITDTITDLEKETGKEKAVEDAVSTHKDGARDDSTNKGAGTKNKYELLKNRYTKRSS